VGAVRAERDERRGEYHVLFVTLRYMPCAVKFRTAAATRCHASVEAHTVAVARPAVRSSSAIGTTARHLDALHSVCPASTHQHMKPAPRLHAFSSLQPHTRHRPGEYTTAAHVSGVARWALVSTLCPTPCAAVVCRRRGRGFGARAPTSARFMVSPQRLGNAV